jgi:hypothetical protein
MQGGYADEIVEAAEEEMNAETAATKEKEAAKRTSKDMIPEETAAPPVAAIEPDPKTYTGKPAGEPARRPVPPPVEEPPRQEKQVGGLDLSTLLDDIRSIGSKI